MTEDQWDCEAYGPDARVFGALCFFAGQGERACTSRAMCSTSMAAERRRMFARIRELAADGDPTGIDLAEAFTDPDQLLGGGGADATGPADQRTDRPGTGRPPPG